MRRLRKARERSAASAATRPARTRPRAARSAAATPTSSSRSMPTRSRVPRALKGEMASDTFDGHKLGWTLDARTLLQQLPAGYLRRRVKAIVEKTARTRRLPAITAEVAAPFVLPEVEALDAGAGPHRAPLGGRQRATTSVRAASTSSVESGGAGADRTDPRWLPAQPGGGAGGASCACAEGERGDRAPRRGRDRRSPCADARRATALRQPRPRGMPGAPRRRREDAERHTHQARTCSTR